MNYKNIKYFQSDLFKKYNFIHAFFTKNNNNDPKELQSQLNLKSNIHFLKQVNSNKVISINDTLDLEIKTGDCLISKERWTSLWIYTADCIPILIADIKTRNIAACHCGLKGLKKNIILKTLNKFAEAGSDKKNLIIAIGPSIIGDNYQVKIKDVNDLIIEILGNNHSGKSLLVELNKQEKIQLYKQDIDPSKLLFDIQAAAILQLYKKGIQRSQINLNRFCTYSNPKLFHSFRRNNTLLRQWSCIYS